MMYKFHLLIALKIFSQSIVESRLTLERLLSCSFSDCLIESREMPSSNANNGDEHCLRAYDRTES